MGATCLKKLGQAHVYDCVASSSVSTTVSKWELRRAASGSLGEECCFILVWSRILDAQQPRVFFVYFFFCFMVLQMFSVGERRGLQADQFSTLTFLL